jgi:gas vesicle protein
MNSKVSRLMRLLFSAGMVLTAPEGRDEVRDAASDQFDEVKERAAKGYDEVRHRIRRASRAIQGDEGGGMSNAVGLLAGVAVGVAVGMLFAPASGEETRALIMDKVQDVQERAQSVISREMRRATGTED